MTRVVVDTNTLVSAILSLSGQAAQILGLGKAGQIEFIFSPATVAEHLRVLCYPKIIKHLQKRGIPLQEAVRFIKMLIRGSEAVMGQTPVDAIQDDPSDNIYLACALEGRADFIISGDRHLRDLKTFRGIPILDPAAFLARFR